MSNDLISRRTVLPAALAGAVALALAEQPAEAAAKTVRFVATAGPAGLVRNQTLISSFFFPPGGLAPTGGPGANAPAAQSFALYLFTIQGNLLGRVDLNLSSGKGDAAVLRALGDGSVRLNDKTLNFTINAGEQAQIIAVLIGLLLPAVQSLLPAVQLPIGTLQCSNNLLNGDGFDAGLGPVNFIVPFAHEISSR
jgi:hypothetical protein